MDPTVERLSTAGECDQFIANVREGFPHLANEALARCPISVLATLLNDPVDAETARAALRRQVVEYGSEEARQLVIFLDQAEEI